MSEKDLVSDIENSKESNGNEIQVSGMYENWFLDYASYVILERAIPSINDGLKPVQKRILHSMNLLEDGRYNKCANIIGSTMQFHPHGDASIEDALVNLGQKDLLIDTQGNWGDIRTGDKAAASRYIEARLSKFALDTFYAIMSGALVMWMAAGFTMLEAGLVQKKDVSEIVTKNLGLFSIACVMYLSLIHI